MNLKLEFEFSKADVLKEVDALKKQIDDLRPLPADVEGRVMQKLRLDWNYNSNAIEGNKLSYGETVAFLMEGITAKGKPLKDHLDIRGHNEAINFLLEVVKDTRPLSEADIRGLHKMILVEPYDSPAKTAGGLRTTKRIALGEYKTSPNHVKTATGEIHYYATPEETPAKMGELMEWYEEVNSLPNIHPIVIAALFHHKFVEIHPFDDGNGRLSRILMNLILMQHGYPPVVVKMDDRTNYYSLLSRADRGDSWPFVEYIAELEKHSLQLYLKAAGGGDIDEDEDIDKEIALFKIGVLSEINQKDGISAKEIYKVAFNEIRPLIVNIIDKSVVFNDLFYSGKNSLRVEYIDVINNEEKIKVDVLGGNYLDQYFGSYSHEHYKIKSIEIEISLRKFKDSFNGFDISNQLAFTFEKNGYFITNGYFGTPSINYYNHKLSDREKKAIVSNFLRDIKSLIQSHINLKSPKP
jgi:Fic family protein